MIPSLVSKNRILAGFISPYLAVSANGRLREFGSEIGYGLTVIIKGQG
jgi:hypothetical protein